MHLPSTPFSKNAQHVLVLQGGGALGAYQAGAFEALCAGAFEPEWVAGISIGAINAALIAGNAPKDRLAKLQAFWDKVSSPVPWTPFMTDGLSRGFFNEASAAWIAAGGVPGFFTPRIPPTQWLPSDDPAQLSHYDTAPLRETLREFVDFGRINHKDSMRLSVGAVNVATGDMPYFDNQDRTITPEHIMASAALPPGFPAVYVEDAYWWDGGISSNTPLDRVIDAQGERDMLIVQIDLFSADGPLPRTLNEIETREKDIRFSSRSRQSVRKNKAVLDKRDAALKDLLARLPDNLKNDPAVKTLSEDVRESAVAVVQLIYRATRCESASKDYNFARANMSEHWALGKSDAEKALRQPGWWDGPPAGETMVVRRLKV